MRAPRTAPAIVPPEIPFLLVDEFPPELIPLVPARFADDWDMPPEELELKIDEDDTPQPSFGAIGAKPSIGCA